jgi:cucumopine synthase-like protein
MADWRQLKAQIEAKIDEVWIEEPAEVKLIKWGVNRKKAGSGGQYFATLVQLETYTILLGQRTLYSLMLMASKPEFDLPLVKRLTSAFLGETFNPFEFLGDLGLESVESLGQEYLRAFEQVQTKEEYLELTGALFTYVSRMHRWIHFIFPWNIGMAFPQRSPEEVRALARIV